MEPKQAQALILQEYQLKQISVFTQKGLQLKAEAEKLAVESSSDLPNAQLLKKQAQALEKEIEMERKTLIFPFQDFVKQVNALATECAVPTEEAKLIISQKLLAYDEKVEAERKIRAEEERKRLEEARLKEEADRKAREEEEARLRKIEQDKLDAIRIEQERERARIALEQDANKKAQRELEAKRLEEEAKLEAQRVEIAQKQRLMEQQQKEIEAQKAEMARKEEEAKANALKEREEALNKVKGVRSAWTYDIENEEAVPRELCSPDSKKINAAIKAGLRVANGLRIFQDKRIQ